MTTLSEYAYSSGAPNCAAAYVWPKVREIAMRHAMADRRAIDIGCGNGWITGRLAQERFDVIGIDPSATGIEQARTMYPGVRFDAASAYDDLSARYGRFPMVVCLEVIEHCFSPAKSFKHAMIC